MPDSEALAAFILRAKRATYAALGDDATVTPLLPGSKQLEYREGERLYREGSLDRFDGVETIERAGVTIYRLRYAGGRVR